MELAYVLVGGLIGIVGGVATAFYSHRLQKRESRRQELLTAYAEWSARLYRAIEEWYQIRIHDWDAGHKELSEISPSLAGRVREEIVRDVLLAMGELEAASSRILMLEPIDDFSDRVIQISLFESVGEANDIKLALEYIKDKRAKTHNLMRSLQSDHPLLKKM